MREDILQSFEDIEGLCWIRNVYVPTGKFSGILLGGKISTNVVRLPGENTEYSVWGIHLATDDQLTFITKADDKPIVVRFVDCRTNSPTLHRYLEIECQPDPTRRLVIPRGIAHLPTNVNGLVTLNTPRIYWDWGKRLVHPDLDVINVERDRPVTRFPHYRVCRFPVPHFLYPAALDAFVTRYEPTLEAPFIFERNGKLHSLRRKHQS